MRGKNVVLFISTIVIGTIFVMNAPLVVSAHLFPAAPQEWNDDLRYSFDSQNYGAMVDSFLSGLHAESPKQAVELWVLGVKNRSGAVQYATLSPILQQKTRNQFEKRSWGTGQSSPWVDNVRIVKSEEISDTKVQYTIEYDLSAANWRWDKKGRKVITVEKNPDRILPHWYITEIITNYNKWEAFTPAETIR